MKRFEYEKVSKHIRHNEIREYLNVKGQDGWECMSFEREDYYTHFWFKREIDLLSNQ